MTIYLASPVATFLDLERFNTMKNAAGMLLDGTVVPARGMYGSFKEWEKQWPAVREKMDCLAFFPDTDDTIGRATYWEIRDMLARGKPVWILRAAPHGGVIAINSREVTYILLENGRNYTKYMRVEVASEQDADHV